MPVRRIVQPAPLAVDETSVRAAEDEPTGQQHLGCAPGGGTGIGVAGAVRERCQAAHRQQRLVH